MASGCDWFYKNVAKAGEIVGRRGGYGPTLANLGPMHGPAGGVRGGISRARAVTRINSRNRAIGATIGGIGISVGGADWRRRRGSRAWDHSAYPYGAGISPYAGPGSNNPAY